MHLHDAGKDVEVLGCSKSADRRHGGEGLEPEFGEEPEMMLTIGGKGLIAMPDTPVMGIATVLGGTVLEVAAGAWGRGPVEGLRVFLVDDAGNHGFKQADVIVMLLRGLCPFPGFVLHFKLIIAAPEGETGMVAKTPDVLAEFIVKVLCEGRGELIAGTGKHHVLPDQDALLIAEIIKGIIREIATTPDADAVESGFPGGGEKEIRPFPTLTRQQIILGNIIGTHGKDLKAVHLDGKVLPLKGSIMARKRELLAAALEGQGVFAVVVVGRLPGKVRVPGFPGQFVRVHSHRAKANPAFECVHAPVTVKEIDPDLVEGLVAVAVRPPKLRMVNRQVHAEMHKPGGPGGIKEGGTNGPCAFAGDLSGCPYLAAIWGDDCKEQGGLCFGNIRCELSVSLGCEEDAGCSILSMCLANKDGLKTSIGEAEDFDGTEESRVGKTRTPVPAEHTGRLSNMGETGHGIRGITDGAFVVFFLYISDGRA